MRELTFDTVYNDYSKSLNLYVDGQLAMVSVNEGIASVIANINKFHSINAERAIADMLLKEIHDEFILTEDEKTQFRDDIEVQMREGNI